MYDDGLIYFWCFARAIFKDLVLDASRKGLDTAFFGILTKERFTFFFVLFTESFHLLIFLGLHFLG